MSKLVKFASDNKLDLAVKGGGHSTGGCSSTDGGLAIDLSGLRNVRVDKDSKLIIAQGGALWEDVDNAAIEKGLATVGGTVNHTGIGGLTLGGGLGWLTGLYGTTIDNLVAAKVVIANGSLLSVSEKENNDLYWAIRGAGHNFGVVVEFTIQGHDQTNEVYAGGVVFTPDKLTAVIDGFNARMKTSDPRASSVVVFAKPPGMPSAVVAVNIFYNGDQAAAEKYFDFLFSLQPVVNTAKMMPYNHVNGLLNAMATHGRRKALKALTLTSQVDTAFVQEVFDDYSRQIEANPDMAATFVGIEFYDLRKLESVPIESTSYANRGSYRAGIIGLEWTDPQKDEENRAWGRAIQSRCRQRIINSKEFSPENKTALEYANYLERKYYSSISFLHSLLSFFNFIKILILTTAGDIMGDKPFGVNQRRLAILKQKYDPDFMFNKTSPIAPLRLEKN